MTQQEKDRLHIQKQNRRFRKLILRTLYPLMGALILASPLLFFGIMMRCATPSEPITVTYSDCRWEGGRHRSLVLYTADGKQWMLTRHLRQNFYQDVKDGLLVPGDRLSITWYPWVLRNAVATLACDGKTYGDLDGWQLQVRKDANTLFCFSAGLFVAGIAFCAVIWYCERKELAEIRRLKRKYRTRLAESSGEDFEERT